MVVLPDVTAVTTPAPSTLAVVDDDELQVTIRPLSTFPAASFVIAVKASVCVGNSVAVSGDTETVATGVGGGGAG